MSETPATPEAASPAAATTPATASAPADGSFSGELKQAQKEQELSIRSLLEAGVHFGHQPGRWNPMLREGLEFIRETTAAGGKVLFVGTKRQAAAPIAIEAKRAGQHYVNNRWLGGMLTNWKTVKKSIDRYNQYLDILGSEDKRAELSKKELSSMSRQVEKYSKSLEGIRAMERPPDAMFVVDVGKESIAVQEANRLNIPVVGVVDTNCSPRHIDFVVPGNDDAIRAIDLYCTAVANACRDGSEKHQAALVAQRKDAPVQARTETGPKTGRRVVEIKQQPRRGRSQASAGGGKSYSAGGGKDGGKEETSAPARPAATPAQPTAAAPAAAEEGASQE
jgi:small subunit ribosomal protein S2